MDRKTYKVEMRAGKVAVQDVYGNEGTRLFSSQARAALHVAKRTTRKGQPSGGFTLVLVESQTGKEASWDMYHWGPADVASKHPEYAEFLDALGRHKASIQWLGVPANLSWR